ncbi:uncharacterized protein V1510DRAFT_408865 [Dipodascopsis tothii]|uniref:uncharacterized protein n=1 Tax=Dipodascopsis tothii TaxID=44089 RepID=UPI0034CFED00
MPASDPTDQATPDAQPEQRHSHVLIIGGGMAGMAAAIKLKQQFGIDDWHLYDNREDFGGTWEAVRYPGCGSDVPGMWYSLSTDLNPNWTQSYPVQEENRAYLHGVAAKRGLRDHATFSALVQSLVWDDESKMWTVSAHDIHTGRQYRHTARLVLMAIGGLVLPQWPSINFEAFAGPCMHTAEWDPAVEVAGKRVVVIGNGSSGAQLVPALLAAGATVTQIVHSAHWMVPRALDKGLYKVYQAVLRRSTLLMTALRWVMAGVVDLQFPRFTTASGARGERARQQAEATAEAYMRSQAPERYHDILVPKFRIGCKRTIFDNGYLASLHDPNVVLVRDDVVEVTADAVVTKTATYPADVIAVATGFNYYNLYARIDIRGRDGSISLEERWSRDGMYAYETTMVDGYPNLFFLGGPNHATGHFSVICTIENVLLYVAAVAERVLRGTATTIEVAPGAYAQWCETIASALKDTVFSTPFGGCTSWYVYGGHNSTAYPWSQVTFWRRMTHPQWAELLLDGRPMTAPARRRWAWVGAGAVAAAVVCALLV